MMHLSVKSFDQLSTRELYDLLKLRSDVFVVEQNCAYPDPDGKDELALHVLGFEDEQLVAYSRLLPPGTSHKEAAIGRVATGHASRKLGYGRALMAYSMEQALDRFNVNELVISAQQYLEKFYTELGFTAESGPYMEDDIPHIKMRYRHGLS